MSEEIPSLVRNNKTERNIRWCSICSKWVGTESWPVKGVFGKTEQPSTSCLGCSCAWYKIKVQIVEQGLTEEECKESYPREYPIYKKIELGGAYGVSHVNSLTKKGG